MNFYQDIDNHPKIEPSIEHDQEQKILLTLPSALTNFRPFTTTTVSYQCMQGVVCGTLINAFCWIFLLLYRQLYQLQSLQFQRQQPSSAFLQLNFQLL